MKKYIAFLLCLIMIVALFSCDYNNGNNTDSSNNDTTDTTALVPPDDNTAEMGGEHTVEQPSKNESFQNQMALQAYGAAIRNEINVYYPLLSSATPVETYFEGICGTEKGVPTRKELCYVKFNMNLHRIP